MGKKYRPTVITVPPVTALGKDYYIFYTVFTVHCYCTVFALGPRRKGSQDRVRA